MGKLRNQAKSGKSGKIVNIPKIGGILLTFGKSRKIGEI
jgi:hypothetical protein